MGRLSRYRKTKNCDPFNLAPGKLVNRDRAPSKAELENDIQTAPRSFRHMMSNTKRVQRGKAAAAQTHDEERQRKKKARGRKGGASGPTDSKSKPAGSKTVQGKDGTSFTRLPGESDAKFLERIDSEGVKRFLKARHEVKPLADRRKTYLNNKKKKKRAPGADDVPLEFKKSDDVQFGEVVQEPPSLSAKPRKAPSHDSQKLVKSLKLGGSSAEAESMPEEISSAPPAKRWQDKIPAAPKSVKSKDLSPLERERMEAARLTAINLYRQQKQRQSEQLHDG